MSSPFAERAASFTAWGAGARIRRATAASVAHHRRHPDEIDDRLDELDDEWDIESALAAYAALASVAGVAIGMLGARRWLLLPVFASAFLLQHAVQGRCAPYSFLRRVGFRAAGEIEAERKALFELLATAPVAGAP